MKLVRQTVKFMMNSRDQAKPMLPTHNSVAVLKNGGQRRQSVLEPCLYTSKLKNATI